MCVASFLAYVTAMPDRVSRALVEWYDAVPSGNVVWRPFSGKGAPLFRGLLRIGVMPGGGNISLHFTSISIDLLERVEELHRLLVGVDTCAVDLRTRTQPQDVSNGFRAGHVRSHVCECACAGRTFFSLLKRDSSARRIGEVFSFAVSFEP